MMKIDKDTKIGIITIVCFILLFIFVWITQSYIEANAFNAATGKNVTVWQAMFLRLRVMEPAKNGDDNSGGERLDNG